MSTQSAKPWLVVMLLMILYTSSFIDRTILNLMVKPIRADLGISDIQFSLLTGFAFVILYSVAAIPVGWMVDRWSRRGLIAAGVAVWSLMTSLCGVTSSFGRFFIARIGVGVGEAALSPAAYSLLSDIFPRKSLSRALSAFVLGVPIGSGLAMIIGGPLVQSLIAGGARQLPLIGLTRPWQLVFLSVGAPGLLLALLAMMVLPEPTRERVLAEQTGFGVVLRYLWQHRAIYAPVFLGMGCYAMFGYAASVWYPAVLQRARHFEVAGIGLFIGTSTLILGVAGAMASGGIADRLVARGRADGPLLVGIAFAAGLLLCGASGSWLTNRAISLCLLYASAFFMFTWLGTCTALVQTVTPSHIRGQVSAIYLFIINLISLGCGPTAVAFATERIFQRPEAVGKSLALVSVVALGISIASLHLARAPVRAFMRETGNT